MARRWIAAALAACGGTASAADLTELEWRWLRAGWPALAYAQQQQLPVDVVVLPAAKPGDAPLAMGWQDGRCKLVLAMRGNPSAQATLDAIPQPLSGAAVEAMMAHEMAHCWRRVNGAWHLLPAGSGGSGADHVHGDARIAAWQTEMRNTRREEGFADLVGLAWTKLRHPHLYAEVHAWFAQQREDQPIEGAHHDTRAWLRLAADPAAFTDGGTPFEQVEGLWKTGIASVE